MYNAQEHRIGQLVYENNSGLQQKSISDNRDVIPYLYIYSDRYVLAPRLYMKFKKSTVQENSLKNLERPKFAGKLSQSQVSTIRKRLTTWFNSVQFAPSVPDSTGTNHKREIVFLTLTLSSNQKHSDHVIKRDLLNHFIITLQRKHNVTHYFWRAETQRNSNIHFHLLIDSFVPYSDLLTIWNNIQEKLGYVTEFAKKHKHRNPNSIDIRKPKNKSDLINYVLKYVAKSETNRLVHGRLFGYSDKLRDLKVYSTMLDNTIENSLKAGIKCEQVKVFSKDFFTVFILSDDYLKSASHRAVIAESKLYYKQVADFLYVNVLNSMPIVDPVVVVSYQVLQSSFDFDFY